MAIDPNIKKKADDIRTRIKGVEVRESLASGLEAMSTDVVENEGRQSVVEGRQDSVESQFQDVIENTTDKDVISAPEIIAARNGEANLKTRIDKEHQEVTAQLAQNGRYLVNYFDLVEDGDYHVVIQTAIDDLYEEDGGTLYLPDNSDLPFGQPLHIRENVILKGGKNTELIYTNTQDLIPVVLYKRSGFKNTDWVIPKSHNNTIFLIDSENVASASSKDKSSGTKIRIEDFRVYSEFTPLTTKKIAFEFMADGGGMWDIHIKDGSIRGANTVFKLETIGDGWINGSLFRDIVIHEFEQVVKTIKSTASRGIDYNIFDHLVIQVHPDSKTLFDDPNNSTYLNTEIWDLHVSGNTQAKMGYTKNSIGRITNNVGVKEMLGASIYKDYYYHLGTFLNENTIYHAQFSFVYPPLDVHSLISVNSTGFIVSKHLGRTPVDESVLNFHTKNNDNGTIELYVTASTSREFSVFINERRGFSPTYVRYENVTGLTEITNNLNQDFHFNDGGIDSETNYTKFPDGTMIVRGRYEKGSVELISDDEVTGIKLLKGVDVNYPQEFISAPTVTTTSLRDFAPISVTVTDNGSKKFTPYLYTNGLSLGYAQMFDYIAIGRWK